VAIDGSTNHIAVTGSFAGTIDFGCGPMTSPAGSAAFLAVFDTLGQCLGSSQVGVTASTGRSVTFSPEHDAVAVGFVDNLTPDGSAPDPQTADTQVVVFRIGPGNSTLASYPLPGSRSAAANAIGIDRTGNAYIAGNFSGTIGSDADRVVSSGQRDIFFAKLATGTF
jgi:hypothetical protein